MSRTCAVCGQAMRKGSRVYVPSKDQPRKLVSVLACRTCASTAVRLLAGQMATRCKCGGLATVCWVCVDSGEKRDRAKELIGTVRMFRGRALAYRRDAEAASRAAAVAGDGESYGTLKRIARLEAFADAWEAAAESLTDGRVHGG